MLAAISLLALPSFFLLSVPWLLLLCLLLLLFMVLRSFILSLFLCLLLLFLLRLCLGCSSPSSFLFSLSSSSGLYSCGSGSALSPFHCVQFFGASVSSSAPFAAPSAAPGAGPDFVSGSLCFLRSLRCLPLLLLRPLSLALLRITLSRVIRTRCRVIQSFLFLRHFRIPSRWRSAVCTLTWWTCSLRLRVLQPLISSACSV